MKGGGGPAFPRPLSTDDHREQCNVSWDQEGMSLRDYFAGQALAGMASQKVDVRIPDAEAARELIAGFAVLSYQIADAMLAERERAA